MEERLQTAPITTEELEKLIRSQLRALNDEKLKDVWCKKHKRLLSEQIPPIMIWGPPGIGKSSVIRDVAEDEGIGFIDVRLSQREPIDIRGLPVPEDDGVHWKVSAEWPRDPNSKGIIIFDELTSADRTLQVAAYEFILDRRLGDLYKLPDGWYIVAAGNKTSDKAVATTFSSALANRFMHVELKADVEVWVKWAFKRDIHPMVIGFIRALPHILLNMENDLERGWPSPRSWERVSTMLHLKEKGYGIDLHTVTEGLVGVGASAAFFEYKKIAPSLPEIYDMMINENNKIQVPKKEEHKWAMSSAITYHLLNAKDSNERKKLLTGFYRITLELTSDFAMLAMTSAMEGNGMIHTETISKELREHPLYKKWLDKHKVAMVNQ